MTESPVDAVRRHLVLHPRVAYQGLMSEPDARDLIANALPPFVPFAGRYYGMLAILDWDHWLPSRALKLRLLAYYDEASARAGESAFGMRLADIDSRDRFPEFDVPDFEGLPADEAYEADVSLDGKLADWRFTSPWRREVDGQDAQSAVATARRSDAFRRIRAETRGRPAHLGDLEAVGWCPPCESQHPRWTLDVWYLVSFDGQLGRGRSLLVDPTESRVVAVRDFAIRAG